MGNQRKDNFTNFVETCYTTSYTASAKTMAELTSFSPFETLQMNYGVGLDLSGTRDV